MPHRTSSHRAARKEGRTKAAHLYRKRERRHGGEACRQYVTGMLAVSDETIPGSSRKFKLIKALNL